MANETVVRLGADASGYILELARAGKSAEAWAATNAAAGQRTEAAQRAVKEATENGSAASTRAINGFMRSLTQQASTAGRTREEMMRLQAATLGVSKEAEPFIRQMEAARGSMERGASQANALNAGLDRISGGAASAARQIGELAAGMSPLGTALVGVAVGVPALMAIETAAYRAVQGLVGVQAEVDKVVVGLKFVNGGDIVAAGRDMDFLRGTATRLGLDLSTTTDAYVKLAAASRETSLEGQRTKDIFTAISEASTVLHLSGEQTSGALMAIQQMMSKGTVQAEELRGQLGERLPGAFQIAARAMGVTTEELGKMLEQGEVIATDFLPRFAAQIRKEFAGAVEEAANSAQASLGRSATAWTDLKRTMVDSGLGEFAAGQMNILTDGVNSVTEAMRRARAEGDGFWGQMMKAAGAVARFLSPANALSYDPQADANRKKSIEAELAVHEPRVDSDRGSAALVRRLKQELLAINSRSSVTVGAGDLASLESEAARQEERDRKAMEGRVKAFIDGGKGKTGREQYEASIKAVEDQFKAAVAGVEKGSELYAQAMATATSRKAELTEKYNKSGVNAARNAAKKAERLDRSTDLEELTQQYRAQEDALRSHLAEIRSQQQLGVISAREALDQERDARVKALTEQAALTQKKIDLSKGADQVKDLARYKGELDRVNAQIQEAQQAHVRAMGTLNQQEVLQVKAYTDSLAAALKTRRDAMAMDVAGVGMGDRARDEMRRLADVQREVDSKKYDLSRSRSENRISDEVYQKELASLQGYLTARVEAERDATAQITAAEADWRNGASRGIATYIEQAQNSASSTASMVGKLFSGMEDWAVRFATTGKVSIKDFADTFIAEIVRMQVRTAAAGFLQWAGVAIQGALGFGSGGGAGAPTSAINTATPAFTAVAAHGHAFDAGKVTAFARGSAFANSVVSTPTTFPMANGRGMMGEAGPEGVFPLIRTSSGDLGVRAVGGGGGGMVVQLNSNVYVTPDGSRSESGGGNSAQMGQSLLDGLNAAIADYMQRAMRQGGELWNWRNGYA
jgi:lambda family phage tail tape measure protein